MAITPVVLEEMMRDMVRTERSLNSKPVTRISIQDGKLVVEYDDGTEEDFIRP